jgi:hypothetical protein
MHKKDLPAGTLYSILKQAGIDKNELLTFLTYGYRTFFLDRSRDAVFCNA